MDVIATVVVLIDVVILLVGLVALQLLGTWSDRRRIVRHFQSLGGHVQAIKRRDSWSFSKDWSSRVYEVHSRDINGQEHCALYRTGFWMGTWKYSPLEELRKKT